MFFGVVETYPDGDRVLGGSAPFRVLEIDYASEGWHRTSHSHSLQKREAGYATRCDVGQEGVRKRGHETDMHIAETHTDTLASVTIDTQI